MTAPGRNRVEIRLNDPDALATLLDRVRTESPDLAAVLATTRDGLVLASSLIPGTPDATSLSEQASALAAAAAGIGSRFAQLANHGRMHSLVMEADRGCVGVHPLTGTLLLVLIGRSGVPLGRFTISVRRATAILASPETG